MDAYLSVRFSLSTDEVKELQQTQQSLAKLVDAISKTGMGTETKETLQKTIDLLTDIVIGKDLD